MFDFEDYKRMASENKAKMNKIHEECAEIRRKELEDRGIIIDSSANKRENFHGDCDHPNTMENGTAIILYIVVMFVGAIFNDRWLIWLFATVIFIRFMTRHEK